MVYPIIKHFLRRKKIENIVQFYYKQHSLKSNPWQINFWILISKQYTQNMLFMMSRFITTV